MHITPQNAQKPKSVKFYRNCCDTAQLKLQLHLEHKPTISLAYKLKAHHRLACFCDKGNLKIALILWLHTHTCILLFSLCVSPVCVSPSCVSPSCVSPSCVSPWCVPSSFSSLSLSLGCTVQTCLHACAFLCCVFIQRAFSPIYVSPLCAPSSLSVCCTVQTSLHARARPNLACLGTQWATLCQNRDQ